MADYDISGNVTLKLRLAVAQKKLELLSHAADSLVGEVLGMHSNRDAASAAKRLQIILQALENQAPNLHQ